jgi:putative membrane protein
VKVGRRRRLPKESFMKTRFPVHVYRHGEEPDPRFSLANERTFLAWIRTSLALLAAAVALLALDLPIQAGFQLAAAGIFAVAALAAAVWSWLSWARGRPPNGPCGWELTCPA